jgi:hypothetical protein
MADKTAVDPALIAEASDGEVTPDPKAGEIDRIDPDPGAPFEIQNGNKYRLQRLKTRQFMRLLRVLTVGAGPMLVQEAFRFAGTASTDEEREKESREFAQRFLTLVMLSIPDAEQQTLDFIKSMVLPAEFLDQAGLTEQQMQRNGTLLGEQEKDWHNPEIEDTIAVCERIVRQEARDLYELGNRLARMWQFARKTGQTKDLEKAAAANGTPQ